jgi:hypothetical protein
VDGGCVTGRGAARSGGPVAAPPVASAVGRQRMITSTGTDQALCLARGIRDKSVGPTAESIANGATLG